MRTLLLAASISAFPVIAIAQVCAPHGDVVNQLQTRHGETRVGIGIASGGGAVFEVYVSQKSKSWTILRTTPDGMTCLVGAGTDYETIKPLVGQPA